MEIDQQQNQTKFERAKTLMDYFCITRISGDDSISVRKEGEKPNGFEYYQKLTKQDCNYSSLEAIKAHQSAINELEDRYNQQSFEMKLNSIPASSILKKTLYIQTLSNRGSYTNFSDEQSELLQEMFTTLVNREKIKPCLLK